MRPRDNDTQKLLRTLVERSGAFPRKSLESITAKNVDIGFRSLNIPETYVIRQTSQHGVDIERVISIKVALDDVR